MSDENVNPASGENPSEKPAGSQPVPPKPAVPASTPIPPSPGQPLKPAVPAASAPVKAQAAAAAAARTAPASPARRQFMINWLMLAWAAFASATAVALSTVVRFLYPNVLFEPKLSFKIGKPDDYELGVVDVRWKEKFGIWVVKGNEGLYALSTVCTHLGCTPSWLENEKKFKCPCHGSGFYASGINFEGPAPRPLERFAVSLASDGQVLVDKSRKFQFEKGEWLNPSSILPI